MFVRVRVFLLSSGIPAGPKNLSICLLHSCVFPAIPVLYVVSLALLTDFAQLGEHTKICVFGIVAEKLWLYKQLPGQYLTIGVFKIIGENKFSIFYVRC